MGEVRNVYEIKVGKSEGKRLLVRPKHRWDDTRMDLMGTWWNNFDWIYLAQDRNNRNEHLDSIKGGAFLDRLSKNSFHVVT
jgi:hypothetical protein